MAYSSWPSIQRSFIILLLIVCLWIGKSSSQFTLISCYECTNCTDPLSSTIRGNSAYMSTSTCNACYKLAVDIAYAPYRYVIRKCVRACLETSQSFGGGLITSSCCSTSLCNGSSMVKFSSYSHVFLLGILFLSRFLLQHIFY